MRDPGLALANAVGSMRNVADPAHPAPAAVDGGMCAFPPEHVECLSLLGVPVSPTPTRRSFFVFLFLFFFFIFLFASLQQPTRSASRRRTRTQAQRPPSTTVGSSAPPALLVRTPCLCAPCQHCCVNVRMCELIYSPCLSEPHSALGHGCCWCYHGRRARRERGAPGCGDLVRVGGEPGAARESSRRHVHHRAAPQAWPDQDQHTVRHGAQHPLRDRHRSPVPLLLHGCASSTRTAC